MIELFAIIFGGFFGWVYGGNSLGLIAKNWGETWRKRADAVDKLSYYLAYGSFFIFQMPILNVFAFGILAASQWARRAVSWGKYIGGLIHGQWENDKGVQLIDELIFADGAKLDYFKFRCALALCIIGGLGGFVIAIGFLSAYYTMGAAAPSSIVLIPVLLGAKGFIYWLCIEIAGIIWGQDQDGRDEGWWLSEIAFNGYGWGAVAYLAI